MEAVIAPDPAAKSRHDFPSSGPERMLLYSLRKIKARQKIINFRFLPTTFFISKIEEKLLLERI